MLHGVMDFCFFFLSDFNPRKCLFNRMESDDDDTSESIIPASSPESSVADETKRFPHLREPKEEESERAISPIIPLIPRTAIPGTIQHLYYASPNKIDTSTSLIDILPFVYFSF